MNLKKLKALWKKTGAGQIRTIRKTLIVLNLNIIKVNELKKQDPEAHAWLEEQLHIKIADLTEETYNRPRQMAQMLQLVQTEELYMQKVFPQNEQLSFLMPVINITTTTPEDKTHISIDTIKNNTKI